MGTMKGLFSCVLFLIAFGILAVVPLAGAEYVAENSFTVPKSVYSRGEGVEMHGSVQQKNYSSNGTLLSNYTAVANMTVNCSFMNTTANVSLFNFTTDSQGQFYSRSDFRGSAPNMSAPNITGDYRLRCEYRDPNATVWHSDVEVRVLNASIDQLRLNTAKAAYNPSETITVSAEALRLVGDRVLYVSNISINGSVQNVTNKTALATFNCTTGSNGKCTTTVTAPSAYGDYFVEANNYKAFSRFSVVPFTVSAYMKDSTGKSYKSTFSRGEQASVEVSVVTNVSSEVYTFSGYVADKRGNVVKSISSTTLNSNNSFTNKFTFTLDTVNFTLGTYYARVTVSKSGDGSIDLLVSFEVKDWTMSVVRRAAASGFEYDYSAFSNTTVYYDIYPKYRGNGTIVTANTSAFQVNVTDKLDNTRASANVSWNVTCGSGGCYQFSVVSPLTAGQYSAAVTLSHDGLIQTARAPLYVIDTVIAAQATNVDGAIKELFGTNEFVYITLSSYNISTQNINLSDAEIVLLISMNGSESTYTNVSYQAVNATNSVSEWGWNTTAQRFRIDVPKAGGVYSAVIMANNRTVSASARFMVNPYDICAVAKNTPGSVSSGSSGAAGGVTYYYVWQFKTTDIVYFDLKAIQANNPLGKATASNFTTGGSNASTSNHGMGSACSVNTQTQQVVNNATVSVVRVINTQNGIEYGVNTTASVCTTNDNEGGYTCTVAPATKWDGGTYSVEMRLAGADGSSDVVYGLFEARAFYLYGYATNWQNGPSNNISLTVRMYEAGNNWWSSYGSGGLAGTVKVEKIEYMGKDGEWIWPPVDSGYNVSALNTTSISTGSGTLSIPVASTKKGSWDSGNYRVILKGTDSAGNTDYGYSWFSVKLWDVYGNPVECTGTRCDYKSYFNSRENVTLYIKINNAGSWSYNDAGGQNLGGNVTIGVRKIQDCRSWPCKELNASDYSVIRVVTNASSPWYWNTVVSSNSSYLLRINKTNSRWGTGYYSVILDVNGSDTGYAWFNTIAFYADARSTTANGTGWKYNLKSGESAYFNTTVTSGYVGWNYAYNASQYVNASVNDSVLRTWDQTTYQSRELNYPEDFNISIVNNATSLEIKGNALVNVTYRTGSWPAGYYWGELTLKNAENETSTAWLWFNAQPFRVELSTSTYEVDSSQCVNATLNIREPDWSNNALLGGNYSITRVYESIWSGSGSTQTTYTNFTNGTSFNATASVRFCPNNNDWGSGSWGGYHYLNVVVNDTAANVSQTGWLSFRATQFRTSYGSVAGGSSKRTSEPVNFTVTLSKPAGGSAQGNITRIYQWRYDSTTSYAGTLETYNFTVVTNGSTCSSSSAGSRGCFVNGSATISVSAPTRGWKVGSNYLYADWVSTSGGAVQDYNGVYFTGLEAYNGWFEIVDANGNWVSGFAPDKNVTLRVRVRDGNYNDASSITIDSIQYGQYSSGCWSDWCATFTTASWSFVSGGSGTTITNGSAIVRIPAPSGGWTKGTYTVKVSVTGSAGSTTISGSSFQIKDFTAPNVTIVTPTINQSFNATQSFVMNITTTEDAVCSFYSISYLELENWYCPSARSSNATNGTTPYGLINACNRTYYGFKNTTVYQSESISRDWYSFYNNSLSDWKSGSTGLLTGGTQHAYTMNITRWRDQDYGMQVWCFDPDYNYVSGYTAFHINRTA